MHLFISRILITQNSILLNVQYLYILYLYLLSLLYLYFRMLE